MLTRVMESRLGDKNRTERHSPSSSWRSQDEDPVTPPRVLRLSLFSKNFNFPPVMLRMQPGALCILRKHSTPGHVHSRSLGSQALPLSHTPVFRLCFDKPGSHYKDFKWGTFSSVLFWGALGTEPRSPCITELHPSPQQQPPLS